MKKFYNNKRFQGDSSTAGSYRNSGNFEDYLFDGEGRTPFREDQHVRENVPLMLFIFSICALFTLFTSFLIVYQVVYDRPFLLNFLFDRYSVNRLVFNIVLSSILGLITTSFWIILFVLFFVRMETIIASRSGIILKLHPFGLFIRKTIPFEDIIRCVLLIIVNNVIPSNFVTLIFITIIKSAEVVDINTYKNLHCCCFFGCGIPSLSLLNCYYAWTVTNGRKGLLLKLKQNPNQQSAGARIVDALRYRSSSAGLHDLLMDDEYFTSNSFESNVRSSRPGGAQNNSYYKKSSHRYFLVSSSMADNFHTNLRVYKKISL